MNTTTTNRGRLGRLLIAASLAAAMVAGSVPAVAAPPERPVMSFEGQLTAVARVGKACSYQADLAVASTVDGQAIVGKVQAKWKDDCPPPEAGSPIGNTYTGKAVVRVQTTAGGSPDGFRFRGVATTASGNPEG